ncbi:DUF1064 domain-containing protein [Alkalicoccobacillus gibsonii]|uniref:DUF1064 domain-containing protein n=1 Tax=Alkalicoccobacillus gibsonii TaxID=79881 RepID=UPI003F7BD450
MGRAKIARKKVVYQGIEFDSKSEYEFFLLLKSDKNVTDIQIQPQYTLLEAFSLSCYKCEGKGKVLNDKTLNMNKCTFCSGTGKKKRQPWKYRADFLVTYANGKQEVIDVKGYANERFPLVKKMFESVTGQELIVWTKDRKKGWVRK